VRDEAALHTVSERHAQMVTRRVVIGAGLASASVACAAGFSAYSPTMGPGRKTGPIDALLIDETTEPPRQMAALDKEAGWTLPVVSIRLDASGQAGLARIFDTSHAIVGISSGATLFCLERIAWDHGFRLTGRSQRCANDPGDDTFQQDVTALLSGSHPPAASPSELTRAYRPSRADGMLHAWVMRKSASSYVCRRRRDV